MITSVEAPSSLARRVHAANSRRTALVDIDRLPDSAACTTRDVAALSGFAEITLKVWRKAGDRGPKVTRIEGRPRYLVKDIRAWMGSSVER